MTEREEIDLLRRELADLRTRVAKIEAERAMVTLAPAIGMPIQPQAMIYLGAKPMTFCSCAPGTVCGNSACPRRSSTVLTGVGNAMGQG